MPGRDYSENNATQDIILIIENKRVAPVSRKTSSITEVTLAM
jgi:hypothetical protein